MLKSILVIDDVKEVLDLFHLHLTELGYKNIVLAENGEQALTSIDQHDFDLVFLDIELPDMNGKAILVKIQQVKPDLAVVMCSAHNTVDNVRLTWEKGAKGFLAKPIVLSKLKSLLLRIGMLEC